MRILHLCLAVFYIDGYSYQENVLPRMHKQLGHDVKIIASTETYVDGKHIEYVSPSTYICTDGIEVTRLPYAPLLPQGLAKKIRAYSGLYERIEQFDPDLVFIHGVQFAGLIQVKKYKKEHPNVRIIADNHCDFGNSAKNLVSYRFLHRIVYRFFARSTQACVEHYYGTLPSRVSFLTDVYGISPEKVSFLPMGCDDGIIEKYCSNETIQRLKVDNGISENDFLVVSGGKFNRAKSQILNLIEAVNGLNDPHVKLILFGSVSDDIRAKFEERLSDRVLYVGWVNEIQAYQYFSMADLVAFPSSHSVYWEQAAGLGKPLLLNKWPGTEYISIDGNAVFVNGNSTEELREVISDLIGNSVKYNEMLNKATQCKAFFSYRDIAQRCIYTHDQ